MKSVGFEGIYLASTQGFGLLDLVLLWSLLAATKSGPLACLAPKFFSHSSTKIRSPPPQKSGLQLGLLLPFSFPSTAGLLAKWFSKNFPTLSCLFSSQNPTTPNLIHSWFWQNFLSFLSSQIRF